MGLAGGGHPGSLSSALLIQHKHRKHMIPCMTPVVRCLAPSACMRYTPSWAAGVLALILPLNMYLTQASARLLKVCVWLNVR